GGSDRNRERKRPAGPGIRLDARPGDRRERRSCLQHITKSRLRGGYLQGEIGPADGWGHDEWPGRHVGPNLDDAATAEQRSVPIQIGRGQRRQVGYGKGAADGAAEEMESVA